MISMISRHLGYIRAASSIRCARVNILNNIVAVYPDCGGSRHLQVKLLHVRDPEAQQRAGVPICA